MRADSEQHLEGEPSQPVALYLAARVPVCRDRSDRADQRGPGRGGSGEDPGHAAEPLSQADGRGPVHRSALPQQTAGGPQREGSRKAVCSRNHLLFWNGHKKYANGLCKGDLSAVSHLTERSDLLRRSGEHVSHGGTELWRLSPELNPPEGLGAGNDDETHDSHEPLCSSRSSAG